MKRVYNQYPRFAQHNFSLIESNKPGTIEFYGPDEKYNPMGPGFPVIELQRDAPDAADEDWLEKAIAGDMLHYLPQVDPEWEKMRREYERTMTPAQKERSKRRYQWYAENQGENRPYEDWFEISDLDAAIRGWLFPDKNAEWPNPQDPMDLPPEHQELFRRMGEYLKQAP